MSLRATVLGILGALAAIASGQIPVSVPGVMVKALHDNNILKENGPNPFTLQPGGKIPQDLTDSDKLGQDNDFQIIHADRFTHQRDYVELDGNVLFLVQGYRVTCDKAMGDPHTQVFTLQGNVRVDGEKLNIKDAAAVTVDFIHRSYNALKGNVQINPSALTSTPLRAPLYVSGRQSYGDQAKTVTLDGHVTTCDNQIPHYEIDGASITVQPGRRAIFRKTKIIILGVKVLDLPYLMIPLDNRTYKYVPYVGQTADEGYFVKWRIGIPLKNPNYNLLTDEDFMTKLGVGLGGTYQYQSHTSSGMLNAYHIFGNSQDLVLQNSHRQVFRWGSVQVDNDYERDNYLVNPNGSQLNTHIALDLPQGMRGADRVNFTNAYTTSQGYSTNSETLSLNDTRDFGKKFQTMLDLNYFSSGSTFQAAGAGTTTQKTERLDVHFTAQKDLNAAQVQMEYQRSMPIGSTPTTLGGSDETPVISLQSDARRLFGAKGGANFPFQTTLSWGDFQDPTDNSHISRGFFDFNFNRADTGKHPIKVDMNGDFKQGIYSDDTAEYVLTYGTNIRYDLGPDTGLNLRYNYMRPYGYSPLPIDQTGQTNFASGDLNIRPIPSLLLGAQTGYDLLRLQQHQTAWQQIGLRSEFQPSKSFLLRGLYTYDTFNEVWQGLRFDMTYTPGATRLSIGAQYDGLQHTWSTVNLFLDNFHWGKMTIGAALAYDGYLRKFDSQQYSFIYDLHCAEAVLLVQENNTGFRAGQQLQFFIRLKALPFDVPFGVGTRGQPVGFNSGSSF
ncbi:MAG TPA: hypothetical protein VG944_16990 [Fimbriimonas sp.]|nr:hypothetical protein [Fimbriimonas sp.]